MPASVVNIHEIGRHKVFKLTEASDLLPVLLKITRHTIDRLNPLMDKMSYLGKRDPHYLAYEKEYQEFIQRWVNKVIRLGGEVKGMWLVDFDCGTGYFCWKYPEESLSYFHKYDETFKHRRKIRLVSKTLI
jgi:hypothetical protein